MRKIDLIGQRYKLYQDEDLNQEVLDGNFRDDLLGRINVWKFTIPSLADRREDIEANVEFELQRQEKDTGKVLRFNTEAKEKYLSFALSSDVTWRRNFRDLSASVMRMTTLADGARITEQDVEEEIVRLRESWGINESSSESSFDYPLSVRLLSPEQYSNLCRFDLVALECTLETVMKAKDATSAARELYQNSEGIVASKNPGSRLSNYLAKYELSFKGIKEVLA